MPAPPPPPQAPRLIWAHYRGGWFAVDALSCLPVTYVALLLQGGDQAGDQLEQGAGAGAGQQLRSLKALRLLRLVKLLRVRLGRQ